HIRRVLGIAQAGVHVGQRVPAPRRAVVLHGCREAGNAIHCPYHNWIYGLDGALITAPNWRAMADIDKGSYGLHPGRAQVWEDLIWVCVDGCPGPLEDHVRPQIGSRLGGYAKLERYRIGELRVGGRAEYDVAANWKLIDENFQECYHCAPSTPSWSRRSRS